MEGLWKGNTWIRIKTKNKNCNRHVIKNVCAIDLIEQVLLFSLWRWEFLCFHIETVNFTVTIKLSHIPSCIKKNENEAICGRENKVKRKKKKLRLEAYVLIEVGICEKIWENEHPQKLYGSPWKMDFFENHYYNINKVFMYVTGIWPYQNSKRTLRMILSYTILNINTSILVNFHWTNVQ